MARPASVMPCWNGEAMIIEPYTAMTKEEWDRFVDGSKNGTFLFRRDYMEYHRDRFPDASLCVRDNGELVALLPATRKGDVLVSHAGLTYGGFVMSRELKLTTMLEIFARVLDNLRRDGIATLVYKSIPHIYHYEPAEEDLYCLFRYGARLYRRDVLSVVDYRQRAPYQERRQRSLRRALKAGLIVRETDDYRSFWKILSANLQTRHKLSPVHTVEEIERLAATFPQEIRLFGAFQQDEMHAGAVVYASRNVCHVQYNAASERGKELAAQDLLLHEILERHRTAHRYFDFGVSTESEGQQLNAGLVEYKEGFGARTVVHDFFELKL